MKLYAFLRRIFSGWYGIQNENSGLKSCSVIAGVRIGKQIDKNVDSTPPTAEMLF